MRLAKGVIILIFDIDLMIKIIITEAAAAEAATRERYWKAIHNHDLKLCIAPHVLRTYLNRGPLEGQASRCWRALTPGGR